MSTDPTARFSDRVDSYSRARPGYPPGIVELIRQGMGREGPLAVADVGSGTGKLTEMLLAAGHTVFAVEPNAPMRSAAEAALSSHPRFRSVDGRAEATTLPEAAVDLVTAAQAFHWFEPEATRAEWRRILRDPGWVAIVWNERRPRGSAFAEAHERFVRAWGTDYDSVRASWDILPRLDRFFGGSWTREQVPNTQELDLGGFEERLSSSSFLPGAGHPRHRAMLAAARTLFLDHAVDGVVEVVHTTHLFLGKVRE